MFLVCYHLGMKHNYYISYSEFNKNIVLSDFELKQIGRIYCNENTLCENHYHVNWYELTIVTDGKGVVFTNNKPISVKKGDIFLSCPYDIHRIETDKEELLKYDFFSFIPKENGLIERLNAITVTNSSLETRLIRDDKISFLVSNAIREVGAYDEELSPLVLNGIFWQVAIYLIRNFEKNKSTERNLSEREVLCFQIMDYINNELYNITNLSDISNVFQYSYNHLSSIFKKTTSITIIEYYNMLRLDIAKTLIEEGNLNLMQIAEKLNYATPYSLSKAFKNRFKVSPREHKKSVKQ